MQHGVSPMRNSALVHRMAKSKDSVSGEANRTWKKGKVHQYPIGKAMTLFYSYLVTEHTYEDTSSGYDTTQTNLI